MNQHPIKILLIEDNLADARLIQELLSEVETVRDHLPVVNCVLVLDQGMKILCHQPHVPQIHQICHVGAGGT